MSAYIGIFSNAGKVLENDEQALAYALAQCGVTPSGEGNRADPEFCRMLLEWFYSGNWISADSEEAATLYGSPIQ